MFSESSINGVPVYTWELGPSSFMASPQIGARLMEWSIKTRVSERNVIHWPAEANYEKFSKIRGGNPILFPFAARSYDRGYENAWRDPVGLRREMPRHGFARDGLFELKEISENGFSAELQQKDEYAEYYPFKYSFVVMYSFNELSFECILRLENKDIVPIPWSAGHHFYFALPWHDSAKREDYSLHMLNNKAAYPTPDGKLAMDQTSNGCLNFSDPSLIERVHWQLSQNCISFGPKGGEEDVNIIIGEETRPQKNFSVVTWTESENSPFYCIEPWMGPPNAAEHGKGLHWVSPGEAGQFKVEVRLY